MSKPLPPTSSAATDVSEFFSDLDGGQFERMVSMALSQVAAGVVDNDRVGEVTLKMTFDRVPGTSQVLCKHTCKFSRPTMDGKAGEEVTRKTVLHVGKYGAITLHAPNQMAFLDRAGQIATPQNPRINQFFTNIEQHHDQSKYTNHPCHHRPGPAGGHHPGTRRNWRCSCRNH